MLERFARARGAGFAGAEIQRLAEGNPGEMARAASEAAMPVVLVNVPSGDFLDGGDGWSGVPGREDAFLEALRATLDAARVLGASAIHLGPSRVPAGVPREECLRCYAANVLAALVLSRASGITLLVEALNPVDSPRVLFHDTASATAFVAEVNHPRFRQQFDVYHSAMSGEDPAVAFLAAQRVVHHVQFSDVPGRHEPGTGQLDFPAILGAVGRSGYTGWLGAEYRPRAGTMEGLTWMPAWREVMS